MLGKALRTIFGIGRDAETDGTTAGGLTKADLEAFRTNFAPLDVVEPKLGAELFSWVATSSPETALLRFRTALASNSYDASEAVSPSPFRPYDKNVERIEGKARKAWAERLKARIALLFDLEGWDAAAVRRYGEILAEIQATHNYRYGFPGSDRSPMWLRSLFSDISAYRMSGTDEDIARKDLRPTGFLTAGRVVEMLALDGGADPAALIDCLYVDGSADRRNHTPVWTELRGLGDFIAVCPEAVETALGRLTVEARVHLLALVAANVPSEGDRHARIVLAAVSDGSKIARAAAIAAFAKFPAEVTRRLAVEGLASASVDDRFAAVRVLIAEGASERLAAHAAVEKSKRIVREIEAAAAAEVALATTSAAASGDAEEPDDGPEGFVAVDGSFVATPPRGSLPSPEVPDDALALLLGFADKANRTARAEFADLSPELKKVSHFRGTAGKAADQVERSAIEAVVAAMRGETQTLPVEGWWAISVWFDSYATGARREYVADLSSFFNRPDVSLRALARLSFAGQRATYEDRQRSWHLHLNQLLSGNWNGTVIEKALSDRIAADDDFRHVVDVAEEMNYPYGATVKNLITSWYSVWDPAAPSASPSIWASLCNAFDAIDDVLYGRDPSSANSARGEINALGMLHYFPKLPKRYFKAVLQRAGSGPGSTRRICRDLLSGAGDLTPFIVPGLLSGVEKERAAAADWLGERANDVSVPALRAALARETGVVARAAIISALADCGDDISDQFSDDTIVKEAEAGLKKTKVDYSDLFDADRLPVLRWKDGRTVPDAVVRWWFARSHKLKQSQGDPLLHMALERLDPADAARLGETAMSAWLRFDTRRPTVEEADAYADANAAQQFSYRSPYQKSLTVEMVHAELRREKLSQYLGTALPHKGLLGLARFVPVTVSVPAVRRYLKDHGKRANQCRALLEMLSANPEPLVLQTFLTVSQRHKQPGTRKYAGEIAEHFAAARGWTAEEMADRTVPTAGFDEKGVLDLSIGDRAFIARLVGSGADLKVRLENPDGKVVSALPAPREGEEEDAADAKKALSSAKKELKQTVAQQADRLYEDMCVAKRWTSADFMDLVAGHPVVSAVARNVVFVGHDAQGAVVGSFRPLEDGSFTDVADAAVDPGGFAFVSIAHGTLLGADAAEAWRTHLSDYEVVPLFSQWDAETPVFDEKATEVADRTGWMIDTFTLRGAATKRGWQRGSIEDAGGFYVYEKHFPRAGMAAVLEFTGSFVPETEKRQAALRALSFARLRPGQSGAGYAAAMPLGKVPPILLGEALKDYHAIAGAGTGHDPDFEKKVGW